MVDANVHCTPLMTTTLRKGPDRQGPVTRQDQGRLRGAYQVRGKRTCLQNAQNLACLACYPFFDGPRASRISFFFGTVKISQLSESNNSNKSIQNSNRRELLV